MLLFGPKVIARDQESSRKFFSPFAGFEPRLVPDKLLYYKKLNIVYFLLSDQIWYFCALMHIDDWQKAVFLFFYLSLKWRST